MAIVLCLTCAVLAWTAAWLLLGGEEPPAGVWLARLRTLPRLARRLLAALGQTRLVALLMAWGPFRLVVGDLRSARSVPADLRAEQLAAAVLVLVGLMSALCSLVFHSLVGLLIVPPAVACLLCLRAMATERKESRELAEEMPDVFRTLATALESGNTLVQAIDYVGLHGHGLASRAFVRTSLRLRCGMPMDDSLGLLAEELDAPGVDLMATALSISQRTGSPLKELFQRLAVLVERSRELERTLAVRTAQVRLSVRVVVGLPPLMIALLSLISADYRHGLMTPAGLACLLVAAAMDGMAIALIRKILRGVM